MDAARWIEFLNQQGIAQIAMAVFLGGAIGLERELRGRPAGLRTMILVCLGSTLVMIVSNKLPAVGGDPAIMRVDPGRIASGVVTGVGFLGAGVIIKLGDLVRGVTTAATIWFVAALGVAIGLEYYRLAAITTLTVVIVLWLFGEFSKYLKSAVYRTVEITVDAQRSTETLARAQTMFDELKMRVMEVRVSEDVHAGQSVLQLYVKTNRPQLSHDTVKQLATGEGVAKVVWR